MRKTTHYSLPTNHSSGFSLIELLVVLAIFSVITAVVLVQGNRFDSSILLTNLAYETALTVREAQVYGISVKGETSASALAFQHAYGVYLNTLDDKSITSFADRNDNQVYDSGDNACGGGSSECLDILKMSRGNHLGKICAISTGVSATEFCSDTNGSFNDLSITFKRPNPDAVIKNGLGTYQNASIYLTSADGLGTRVLKIESTGQISIE
ncbi:MAG: prepilin-type N-terminal cleavage/methylation domain-containing protein [Candidatus Paceibacterota bacterium]